MALAVDNQVADLLHGFKIPGVVHPDTLVAGLDRARQHHPVLTSQDTDDSMGMYAQRGTFGHGNVHIHSLGACAENLDARYIFHQQKFALDEFRIVFEFSVGKTVSGKGKENAIDVPEIIFHPGRSGPLGQIPLGVGYFPAEHIPQLLNLFGAVMIHDVHIHDGDPGTGNGINVLHLVC